MNRLNGKVAIITGGSGGIGAATARRFVAEGAKVLLVDRDESSLVAVAKAIGGSVAVCVADVSKEADVRNYVQQCTLKFGGVDILFDNAGVEGKVGALTELSVEDFDRVLAVNARGAFLGIKHVAPVIAKRGGGSIVVTSSVAGVVGSPGLVAYIMSKHAAIGLARTAAIELAPLKIRVNTLNPGPIENRMMRSIEEQAAPHAAESVKAKFTAMVPLGRYGTNEEMASLATFLASDESSYCTGGVFLADGGFTAM
jgi:NAD(P)-dependent dehydrogenase (short-subunit alcohol dehydrogenase family)